MLVVMVTGQTAADRLNEIARASETATGVTRLPFTPEHSRALEIIERWMRAAGLETRRDAAATLIGRTPGNPERSALLLGSHQDSVREGGRFDGIMGVLLPCLALERLGDVVRDWPVSVEVLAFADEEGVRFPTALLGPRALAGTVDPAVFDLADRTGTTLGAALTAFGGDPAAVPDLARAPGSVVGFVETHIEQGPVLEASDRPLGVVTAICGISRREVVFAGETGHAGTVPMAGRRDALVAASTFVAEVSRAAGETGETRATVGTLDLHPGAVNAIPCRVRLTLEIRSPQDDARRGFEARTQSLAHDIGDRHRVGVEIRETYVQPAVACDPALRAVLTDAIREVGADPLDLPSGATHDASAMADLCAVGMLFVRCQDGVSHRPEEFAAPADMGRAIDALEVAIQRIGRRVHLQ